LVVLSCKGNSLVMMFDSFIVEFFLILVPMVWLDSTLAVVCSLGITSVVVCCCCCFCCVVVVVVFVFVVVFVVVGVVVTCSNTTFLLGSFTLVYPQFMNSSIRIQK
jgi:hypothetical protein